MGSEVKSSLMNKDWRKALLHVDATLQQAIQIIDETALQIVLITSRSGALIGTITDGDIRRGLLRGLTLDNSIDSIIQRDPLVVPPYLERDTVLQLMNANKIHQLPIVDKERNIVGLHLLDDLIVPSKLENTLIIMAGGRGVRMRPHTENCPKPLLPVAGKPMLEHIIERAKSDGFKNFVLAIHYLGNMIEDYCRDGRQWGVNIEYLKEDIPLGTVGAIGLLKERPNAPFLVTNGDVLTDIHYNEILDFHILNDATATMAVRIHEWQHPFGVVKTKGIDIIGFNEKPIARSHINAGVYVLEPDSLDSLDQGEECDMPKLFNRLQDKKMRTIVYPMHEPWLDIGCPQDYEQANNLENIDVFK